LKAINQRSSLFFARICRKDKEKINISQILHNILSYNILFCIFATQNRLRNNHEVILSKENICSASAFVQWIRWEVVMSRIYHSLRLVEMTEKGNGEK